MRMMAYFGLVTVGIPVAHYRVRLVSIIEVSSFYE